MDDIQKLSFIVGKTIGLFPEDVKICLEQNGVVIDTKNYNLSQLIEATLNGLRTSPMFLKAFSELAEEKQMQFAYLNVETADSDEKNFSNAAGSFSYSSNLPNSFLDVKLPTTTATSPTPTTTTSGKLGTSDYIGIGSTILNLGTNIWGQSQTTKSAQQERDAQLKMQQIALEIAKLGAGTERDKLIAQQQLLMNQPATQAKSNTGLYVALGIGGFLILGLFAFVAIKMSNRPK